MNHVLTALAAISLLVAPTVSQAQTRDVKPPRDTQSMSQSGDRANSVPQADLYASFGGFDEDSKTNWVLVIVNKGLATAKATNVAFVLETTSDVETVGKFPIPAIGPDQSEVLVVNSLIPVDAIKRLYADIDRPDIVSESDESNNRFIFKDNRADSERPAYIKIPMKRLSADGDSDAALRKRPGRTKYGDNDPSTTAGGEHEIEYDISSGAFKSDDADTSASGVQARGARQQQPVRDQQSLGYAGSSSGPLIKCNQDQNGLWGCNCSKTNAAICKESMSFAGCKTPKQGGLADPEKWTYTCTEDHSDE